VAVRKKRALATASRHIPNDNKINLRIVEPRGPWSQSGHSGRAIVSLTDVILHEGLRRNMNKSFLISALEVVR
jgi:hypothetical protein